jgi:hypothetical protein
MSQKSTEPNCSGNTNKVVRFPNTLDDEEIEVRVRFPRMASFSAPESKTNRSVK